MKKIVLKAGTKGETQEFSIEIPKSVEDYTEKGYTNDAIEDMLEMDLRRKLATIVRQDMESENPLPNDELAKSLEAFIYVPGRKSGTGKEAKIRKEEREKGKLEGVNFLAQLDSTEIMTFAGLTEDMQREIIGIPNIADVKTRLEELAE